MSERAKGERHKMHHRGLGEHQWRDDAPVPPAAAAYLRAWEEYIRTPQEQRDHGLIRDLCNRALEEMLP